MEIITPFQYYRNRIILRLQQLKLAEIEIKKSSVPYSPTLEYEKEYYNNLLKDIEENMIPREKQFIEQCLERSLQGGDLKKFLEDLYSNIIKTNNDE